MALNKAWSEEREMGVNLMPSSPSKNKRPLCLLEMMMHFRQYCVALSNLLVTSFAKHGSNTQDATGHWEVHLSSFHFSP